MTAVASAGRSVVALSLAVVVFALTVLAVSPSWHAWLHGDSGHTCSHNHGLSRPGAMAEAPHPFAIPLGGDARAKAPIPAAGGAECPHDGDASGHACAVTFFAQGVELDFDVWAVPAGALPRAVEWGGPVCAWVWQPPVYWHRPALAPPGIG